MDTIQLWHSASKQVWICSFKLDNVIVENRYTYLIWPSSPYHCQSLTAGSFAVLDLHSLNNVEPRHTPLPTSVECGPVQFMMNKQLFLLYLQNVKFDKTVKLLQKSSSSCFGIKNDDSNAMYCMHYDLNIYLICQIILETIPFN